MEKYQDVVTIIGPPGLIPIVGANVAVSQYGVVATTAIYSDNGSTLTGNPLRTDSSGRYSFYAANGRYSLEVSGTGLQTTTLSDILLYDNAGLFVDVTASPFNAIGDGTTSCTDAIQNALDYLNLRGGGTLYFPPGTYYCPTPVFIDDIQSINFLGSGTASKLTSPNKSYIFAQSPGSSSLVENCQWSNLQFLGTYGPTAPDYGTPLVVGQTGIYLNTNGTLAANRIWIHHCFFNLMAGGVYATSSTNLDFSDNIFFGCLAEIQIGSGGVVKGIFTRNMIDKIKTVIADDAIAVFGPSSDVLIGWNKIDRKRTTTDLTTGSSRIIVQPGPGNTTFDVKIICNTVKNTAFSGFAGLSEAQRGSIVLATLGGTLTDVLEAGNTAYNGMSGFVYDGTGLSQIRTVENTADTMQQDGFVKANASATDFDVNFNKAINCGGRSFNFALITKLGSSANTATSGTGLAYVVDQCTGFTSVGDRLTNNASDGFRINATPFVKIHSATIENNGGFGMNFTGASQNPNLLANGYASNTSGAITGLTTQITAAPDDTTPSVRNLDGQTLLIGANTSSTVITQLDDGTPGMVVRLQGINATNASTIADGGNFKLTAGITMTTDTAIVFYTITGTTWIEQSRAVN